MPEIIISVQNKIPTLIGNIRTIVTDNSDYTIRFIFDDQWDEGEKTVYLIRSNGYAYPPVVINNDTVEVPIQYKAGLGTYLCVGVQQGNIKTSAAAHIAIRASAIDAIDDEAVQPSAELWNEVLQRLRDVEESISPEELERIVNEYLKENPITESVKSVNGQTGEVKLNAADIGALPASTQIPGKTSDLQNDSGFITQLVSDLANYYTKNQTYSREEVDARVSAIPKFSISVVSSLPTSNISETTVYLVKAGSASGDMYTEYIRANGAWEILGSQRVDLTGYATEAWVNVQLADYLTADKLTAAIITNAIGYTPADAEDVSGLEEAIADKADAKGWTPDKFIGTDAEGNLVEKDAPTGGGAGTVTSVNGVQPDENGNVTVEVGQPTDAQIGTAVDTWLNEHPEATTTVADGSITPEKIHGAIIKNQIFDLEDFNANFEPGWLRGDGSIEVNTDTGGSTVQLISPYWKAKPNTTYTANFMFDRRFACYDAEYKFLGNGVRTEVNGTYRYTTLENTVYIRINTTRGSIPELPVICEGEELYDHYFVGKEYIFPVFEVNESIKDNSIEGKKLKDSSVTGEKLADNSVKMSKFEGIQEWNQIFDLEDFNANFEPGWLRGDGSIEVNTDTGGSTVQLISPYWKAKPNTTYTANFMFDRRFACYDAEYKFLGNGVRTEVNGTYRYTTLENTVYIRINTTRGSIPELPVICEGEELYPYYFHGVQYLLPISVPQATVPNSLSGEVIKDSSIPLEKLMSRVPMKILCLGDSLTQGTYPAKVAELLNCEVVDAGIGGNTINAINNRVGNYGTDFNVVTLMCGTNDNGGQTSCPLGTIEDEAATNDNHSELTTTYVSRLKRLLNTIKATHPSAIYILMPPFEHEWGDLEGVVNMMEEIAKLYRIPYLDIFHECGWSGKNEADKAIYMADSTHENAVGAQRIAGMLAGYIRQLTGM